MRPGKRLYQLPCIQQLPVAEIAHSYIAFIHISGEAEIEGCCVRKHFVLMGILKAYAARAEKMMHAFMDQHGQDDIVVWIVPDGDPDLTVPVLY